MMLQISHAGPHRLSEITCAGDLLRCSLADPPSQQERVPPQHVFGSTVMKTPSHSLVLPVVQCSHCICTRSCIQAAFTCIHSCPWRDSYNVVVVRRADRKFTQILREQTLVEIEERACRDRAALDFSVEALAV